MAFPKVGNLAPKFFLSDHEGNTVSLADFKGKSAVVVYFYPKAMTPGCTLQAQGLRDSAKALKGLNTVVLGISPDPVKKLAKFAERDELNFQLLSDEDHATADKYGAWEGAGHAPEEAFLAAAKAIPGVETVETQTFTIMPL